MSNRPLAGSIARRIAILFVVFAAAGADGAAQPAPSGDYRTVIDA
jgi:hypothetical protein